jgi:hypothetical protein
MTTKCLPKRQDLKKIKREYNFSRRQRRKILGQKMKRTQVQPQRRMSLHCICSFCITFFSATIDGRNLIFGHKLHIGSPYRGPIRFLLPVCRFCWFLYTFNIHLYMHIFRCIFLSNYWWRESDIWSQASYRYAILWVAFLDPSDSYFLFAEERGYHKWAFAHSSSCLLWFLNYLSLPGVQ